VRFLFELYNLLYDFLRREYRMRYTVAIERERALRNEFLTVCNGNGGAVKLLRRIYVELGFAPARCHGRHDDDSAITPSLKGFVLYVLLKVAEHD
jgi:hypothetical protein